MNLSAGPLFSLYVVWHPSYQGGRAVADQLRMHYSRDIYKIVGGERGVSVLERNEPTPNASMPLPIDWDETEFVAVIVLAESMMVDDRDWVEYIKGIAREAQAKGRFFGFIPVTMDSRGAKMKFDQQAICWNLWKVPIKNKCRRLISDLTHEFCRMLRHRLDEIQNQDGRNASLGHYLRKIQVFISHTKHDDDGELVAHNIRNWIHENSQLTSFFDVYDIPPGQSFEEVLMDQIGAGAAVAVHTDTYSSREWCHREVIEAKRHQVPMIVIDCLRDADPRGIPYLGNVPIIRMEPSDTERVGEVIGCILDEIFRTWLWLCRVGQHLLDSPSVLFSARTPELITLAALPRESDEANKVIVHPEPLLSRDEARLFAEIAPSTRVLTLLQWLEEQS